MSLSMCLVLLLLSGAVGMKISTYGSGVSTGRTNKFHRVTTQPKTNLKITITKCFCISFAVNVHGLDSNNMKESMVICYCKAKMIWALTQVAQRSLGDVLSSNYSHCEFVRKLLLHLQFEHSEFSLTSLLHEKKNHISHAENEKWTHPDDTAKQLAALQHDVHWFSEVWRAPSESIIENIWIF